MHRSYTGARTRCNCGSTAPVPASYDHMPTLMLQYRQEIRHDGGDLHPTVAGHPALKLVHNSEQLLTARYSRRLITMEKVGGDALFPFSAACAVHFATWLRSEHL